MFDERGVYLSGVALTYLVKLIDALNTEPMDIVLQGEIRVLYDIDCGGSDKTLDDLTHVATISPTTNENDGMGWSLRITDAKEKPMDVMELDSF